MLVFDAYPLAAVLRGEAAGATAGRLLAEALENDEASVAAPSVAEVIDLVARAASTEAGRVSDAVDLWIEAGLRVEPLDLQRAQRCAALRVQHYHRTRCPVSLADCAALALADELDAALVTSDRPMAAVASALKIRLIGVEDSTGRSPGQSDG